MNIQAVIGNRKHTDYGVVSIPFPIPQDQYSHIVEMLEAIEICDVLRADCYVAEINSTLPVLKCLEETEVNLDELDFLVKRLDSFTEYELLQFQAMAAKHGYCEVKDLINLSYSCQEVTVVSDFSDLEKIGHRHFLNTNGGMADPTLAQKKSREVALNLLWNDRSGTITPYGVVYENNFQLDEVYDGIQFPAYRYSDCVMELDVVQGESTATLFLPASEAQISRTLTRSNIDKQAAYEMKIVDSSFCVNMEEYLLMEAETIYTLNHMCEAAEAMGDPLKLGTIIRCIEPSTAEQVVLLTKEADNFDFVPGIHSPEEYGKYFIQDSGHYTYDDELADYYDYQRFGEDRIALERGVFDESGYVCYNGTLGFDEIMERNAENMLMEEQRL